MIIEISLAKKQTPILPKMPSFNMTFQNSLLKKEQEL